MIEDGRAGPAMIAAGAAQQRDEAWGAFSGGGVGGFWFYSTVFPSPRVWWRCIVEPELQSRLFAKHPHSIAAQLFRRFPIGQATLVNGDLLLKLRG